MTCTFYEGQPNVGQVNLSPTHNIIIFISAYSSEHAGTICNSYKLLQMCFYFPPERYNNIELAPARIPAPFELKIILIYTT